MSDEENFAGKLFVVAQASEIAIPPLMRLWMECGKPTSATKAPQTPAGIALATYWEKGYLLSKARIACIDALRIAADADCVPACEFLSDPELLLDRESDLQRARDYGKKAAILGHSEGFVGWLLYRLNTGAISEDEFDREIDWATGHDRETGYYVATYFDEMGEAISAQRWVDRAMRSGSVRARQDKGLILWETRRWDEAVEMWRVGADQGDAACAAELLDLFHTDIDRCANFCLKENDYAELVLQGLDPYHLPYAAQTLMERGDTKEALWVYTIASHFQNESGDEDSEVFPLGQQLALMSYPDKAGQSPLKPALDWVLRRLNPTVSTPTLILYTEMWEDICGHGVGRKFSEEWVQHYAGA